MSSAAEARVSFLDHRLRLAYRPSFDGDGYPHANKGRNEQAADGACIRRPFNHEVEGMVGDAAVRVDAAIIVARRGRTIGVLPIGPRDSLRIPSKLGFFRFLISSSSLFSPEEMDSTLRPSAILQST